MWHDDFVNIRLSGDGAAVVILDQTLLPNEIKYLQLSKPHELYDAINTLKVRGAPAIGIFAAYALYVLARQQKTDDYNKFRAEVIRLGAFLDLARPTAVNLSKQLRRMERLVKKQAGTSIPQILENMREEAEQIRREDIEICRAISENGLKLINEDSGILTYCNAGPLATSGYGTALGPILLAKERGIDLNVYCCETRPLLQGARLTTYELNRAGVACTLICDNMASIVMSEGRIDAVFVGCDRVALNGDVANKVGTNGLAILAKYYDVKFYVFCPSTTIDADCATGVEIKIEMRQPGEMKEMLFKKPIAPHSIDCFNPAFDVTDNTLITAIITENGICKPPYTQSLTQTISRARHP